MIRVISGDNELSALEFQRHYRLPIVHLLDPSRTFDKKYNRNGWPFLMLVDPQGRIVYKKNGLVDREEKTIRKLLDGMLDGPPSIKPIILDGTAYMPGTLKRNGEGEKPLRRERFSSLACGPNGEVYLLFTTNRNGNSDIFMRNFDGEAWSEDKPVAATGADEYDGMVMVDKQNRVWISWTSNADSGNYNIFVTTLTDISKPGEPVQITHANDDAMHARMAYDRKGNIYLIYYKWHLMGQRSRDKEVYLRQWAGSQWSDEIQISPTNVPVYEDHSDPAIIAQSDGVIVSWSWDFHRPRGYTREAESPTIFARTIDAALKLGRIIPISGHQIDVTPVISCSRENHIWCAWDSLGRERGQRGYRKTLAVKEVVLDNKNPGTETFKLCEPVINICTPTFAVSPAGFLTLLWSETIDGDNWVLKQVELDPERNKWSSPKAVESNDNPRFCSACYDSTDQLWVSYSIETNEGRQIVAKKVLTNDH